MRYWAVIGDLARSRRIRHRAEFQRRLETLLDQVNRRFTTGLVSRWVVTAGDEFQALYVHPEGLVQAVHFLCEEIWPQRARFGVGYGGLATALKDEAVGMDGPAFYAARAALEEAKRGRYLVRVAVALGPGRPRHPRDSYPMAGAVSDIWDLVAKVVQGRHRSEQAVARWYRELGKQVLVAERLGISQGAVSKSLARGLYLETKNVVRHLPALLRDLTSCTELTDPLAERQPPGAPLATPGEGGQP
ncbi:MAG: SatD family protein [Symbiobacteriaceae bacterium]|nr:MAG: hypothetical protein DIU69_01585 [Bacillota bacterium]